MKKFLPEFIIVSLIILFATIIFFQYLKPKGSFKRVTQSIEMTVKTQQSKAEGYFMSSVPAKKANKILAELTQGENHTLILIDPGNLSQKKIFEIKSKSDINPSISHNGELIAVQKPIYSSRQQIQVSQVSIIDINGKEVDYISKYQTPFSLNGFSFSPKGDYLAYTFALPNQTYPEIFVEKELKYFDNSLITQEKIRIPNPEKAANHFPQFMPSGKAVAFFADYAGSPDICIFDLGLQTPELIRLTSGAQAKSNGKNLFAIDVKEEFIFYVQNAFWEGGEKICAIPTIPSTKPVKSGTISMTKFGKINYSEYNQNVIQISQIYNKITQLFVSPDGKDLIFSADGKIITMKVNGSKVMEIAKGNFAQFSPDQKQILVGINEGKNKSSVLLFDFEVKRQDKKISLDGQIENLIWF